MKIFHIVEELSDKNNSIISVTKILSKYKNLTSSRIVIPQSQNFNKNKKNYIKTIDVLKRFFKFNSEIYKFIKENKPDVLHIHGLWRPIHILFIINSRFLDVPIIVQPHGMLLNEAIKSKSLFSYYLKLIVLFFYKFLLSNAYFIAVTRDEKISIYKYFKKNKIFVIPNPFISPFKVEKKIKSQISFFGRFSPHKNLDLIINSFINAKLNKNWKLIIYGIDDDKNYKNHILKIISASKLHKRILVKKPIFNTKLKFKKMSENFLNILMSKSEILSLSVLESLSVGTKSLVNRNIKYPKNISKLLYFTEPNEKLIAKKINEITHVHNHSFNSRNKIKEKFKKIYSSSVANKQYKNLITKIKKYKPIIFDVSLFNISIANGLNSFLIPYLVVIYGFINPAISAEIGIIQGTIIFILQIFSSNSRVILLLDSNEKNFENFIFFRSLISIIILTVFYFFFKDINFIEENFHVPLICLLLILWINEITLVFIEKKKLKFLLKAYIFLLIVFYIFLTLSLFFFKINLNNLFINFFVINIFVLFYFFNFKYLSGIKYKLKFFYENIYSFLSTLSNSISVIFWRYSILYFTNKELAGLIFAIFSIASFPGTFFNNILGQSVLRNKKLSFYFLKFENIFYIISLLFLLIIFLFFRLYLTEYFDEFVINITFMSMIGTIIMIASLRKRHKNLYNFYNNKNVIFKKDIAYSLSIFPLIIMLFYFNGVDAISFAYLVSSLISYFFYSLNGFKNI